MSKLSEKIRILRKNREWTQAQLADAVCLSESAIQKWETDKNVPPVDVLKRLANIFEISIADLIDDDIDIPEYFEIDSIFPDSVCRWTKCPDSQHHIYEANLRDCATLHRFLNNAGVPYSAIYVGRLEVYSCERRYEQGMISYWNRANSII